LAAGLTLLSAFSALAAEPAATGVLQAIGSDGQPSAALRPLEEGQLKPLDEDAAAPVAMGAVWSGARVLSNHPFLAGAGLMSADPQTCLAQAVYFEARSEAQDGQRAVAQVVMNRTRLPQFAPSVCGVVYQGAERGQSCQFTFVCDGSLRPPDNAEAWDRANSIAKDALGGFVYTPMLAATHYHAAWMRPYWASSLHRIARVGGQVFYH
jgi:spore germination cell wall hydrolase CwlJ-like protein